MANSLAPVGFREYGLVDGSVPNFGQAKGLMLYTTACFSGDPLKFGTAGYLAPATATGNTGAGIAGIAYSFTWVSIAQGRTVRSQYYPGSDSVGNADVTVHYTNNPGSLFYAQATSSSAGTAVGGPLVQADVGTFFNFATGAGGNTQSGASSFSIDFSTQNASIGVLPFYLYNLLPSPSAAGNFDPTLAGNWGIFGIATWLPNG